MKALILNNTVVDFSETEFEVHPSMSWVDCNDSVKLNYTYSDGSFSAPVEPTLTAEQQLDILRAERNQRLANTDWWASSDLTMTAAQTAYRQALRDITDTYTSLDDVVWPEVPNE